MHTNKNNGPWRGWHGPEVGGFDSYITAATGAFNSIVDAITGKTAKEYRAAMAQAEAQKALANAQAATALASRGASVGGLGEIPQWVWIAAAGVGVYLLVKK